MWHTTKGIAATSLSILLALSPLLGGCASGTPQVATDDEMTRDINSLDLAGTESPQSIDYNEEGAYTVSFTEPDLMSYAAATSIGPEVVVEDDEMSRDGDSSNMATDQELIVEDEHVHHKLDANPNSIHPNDANKQTDNEILGIGHFCFLS